MSTLRWGLCLLLCGVWLWGGCGGEVTINPGCENCPDRCIQEGTGRGRCVACLRDEQCRSDDSPTRKCENQRCVCGSNQDCTNGRVCAGTSGCVECTRDEHCNDEKRPFCTPDSRCVACKSGQSRACLPEGSEYCVKGTQVCKPNGQWGDCEGFKNCESNEKCEDGKCILDCPPTECKASENKCTTSKTALPGKFLRCVKDAKGCLSWGANERNCGDKEICDEGQCMAYQCPPAECKLDETRCVGSDAVRRCIKNENGCLVWDDKKACPQGSQCRDSLKRCSLCAPKSERACYTGDSATRKKGLCVDGKQVCNEDGDAFGSCVGEVLPATEVCNGKDDDCDGSVDEDFKTKGTACSVGKGSCESKGSLVCKTDGSGMECDAKAKPPVKETCNKLDDDCNGLVDDNLTQTCYSGKPGTAGKGICKEGKQTCANGQWGKCVGEVGPGVETCNKLDDDCNGLIDDNLTQTCYSGKPGAAGNGICKAGKQTCSNGKWGTCVGEVVPLKEACNTLDDDCNGVPDDNLDRTCYSGKAGTAGKGVCKEGKQTCSNGKWGACVGEQVPQVETCNKLDDDCDGLLDDNLSKDCYTGTPGTEGKGICVKGKQTCSNGQWGACVGQQIPQTETCNGKDDDCDGQVDGMKQSCYKGPPSKAGVGICKTGLETCTNGQWGTCVGYVLPSAQEVCNNNKDDDCNGQVDDCSVVAVVIRQTIDTTTGRIDGVLWSGWKGQGRFEFKSTVQIQAGAKVVVSGGFPLKMTIQGNFQLLGTLDLAGKKGGNTNCQTPGAGQKGGGGGGGGGDGGAGGACLTGGQPQPSGGNGLGASPGKGGKGGTMIAGGGGGAGHAVAGTDGLPLTPGGKGGPATGSAVSGSPGSGGGAGACGVGGFSILSVYTPGAGGGGGGGAILVEATGNMTLSGSILTTGADGGVAPRCELGSFAASAGGGGGGGAGGSIRLRAKGQMTVQSTAFLSAEGGQGKGQFNAKGGNGSVGFIRLEDSDGIITFPATRVLPAPSLAKY